MTGDDPASPAPANQERAGLKDKVTTSALRIAELLSRFPPPRLRQPLLAVAAAVFVLGGTLAARRLDLAWEELGWVWLVLASIVGVPLAILANTMEFQLSGRVIGARIGLTAALKVSVLSSAANLLPIPGAAVVRIQALRQGGQPYSRATFTTALMGAAWVGVAASAAGALLVARGIFVHGAVWAAAGASLLVVSFLVAARRLPHGRRVQFTLAVIGVEALSVVVSAFRLYVVLLAMDEQATITAATLLALAGVLASAVGIFPGGLGLRELLSALLLPVAGGAAAAGFLASAVDRIVGLAVHAPLAATYSVHRDKHTDMGKSWRAKCSLHKEK